MTQSNTMDDVVDIAKQDLKSVSCRPQISAKWNDILPGKDIRHNFTYILPVNYGEATLRLLYSAQVWITLP